MVAIRPDEEKVAFVTEMADASTGATLFLNKEVIVVVGLGEVGDSDDRRSTDAPNAGWTITPLKHTASGSMLRAEMAILVETAFLVEITALGETMLKEATRKRATNAGSEAMSDPIVFTTNKRWKRETEFAKSQLQSRQLEIKISSDYPVMLPTPPPPIHLGLLIPWPLTICGTIQRIQVIQETTQTYAY